MDYSNKIILAPMVRVSTLPVRLLALEYGADIVFTEELVDWKLLSSVRQLNKALGTVDYVDPADGTVTLRTCAEERSRVVLQMGTCDPDRALKVAQKYENDVAGIDINMGCPKEFSIKGGMGAALLQQPKTVKNILTSLVKGVKIPVTCKIRLLATDEQTLSFCRMVESCGVAALTVHGRTRHERPRHPVHEDAIRRVAETLAIPVIANGGSRHIRCREEADQFRSRCGAASVMLARAAMWNLSVFRAEGPLEMDQVITRLLQLCVRYSLPFTQAKYTVQQMLRELQETPRGKRFLATQTLQEICAIWGLGESCRALLGAPASPDSRPMSKRPRLEDDILPGHRPFVRGHYKPEQLPKTLLHAWSARHGLPVPSYQLEFSDKLFRAVCSVRGQRYASLWEKNKKFAEQGSALTCCVCLGIAGLPTDVGAVLAGQPPDAGAVLAGQPPDVGAVLAGQPPDVGAVLAGQPPDVGAVPAGQPPDVSAVLAGQPPDVGAVLAGQPPDAGAVPAGQPPDIGAVPAGQHGRHGGDASGAAQNGAGNATQNGEGAVTQDGAGGVTQNGEGAVKQVGECSVTQNGAGGARQNTVGGVAQDGEGGAVLDAEGLSAGSGVSAGSSDGAPRPATPNPGAGNVDCRRRTNGVPPALCSPIGGD